MFPGLVSTTRTAWADSTPDHPAPILPFFRASRARCRVEIAIVVARTVNGRRKIALLPR